MIERMGHFKISCVAVHSNPEAVRAVMARCIIVRCEQMYMTGTFDYTALSPDFDQMQPGEVVPEYVVDLGVSPETVTFRRVAP